MADHILTFGKHKDATLGSLLESDPKYIVYLVSGQADKWLPEDAKKYCMQAVGAVRVGFGKFKDLTYAELRDIQPGYLRWMSRLENKGWINAFLAS